MKRNKINKSQMGFGLIEIVLVLVIILFLYFIMSKSHLGIPQLDKETQESVSEQGIDTTNYRSLLSTVKKKVQDTNDQEMKRANEIEGL